MVSARNGGSRRTGFVLCGTAVAVLRNGSDVVRGGIDGTAEAATDAVPAPSLGGNSATAVDFATGTTDAAIARRGATRRVGEFVLRRPVATRGAVGTFGAVDVVLAGAATTNGVVVVGTSVVAYIVAAATTTSTIVQQ